MLRYRFPRCHSPKGTMCEPTLFGEAISFSARMRLLPFDTLRAGSGKAASHICPFGNDRLSQNLFLKAYRKGKSLPAKLYAKRGKRHALFCIFCDYAAAIPGMVHLLCEKEERYLQ
ncbi:MAG: hypothetical protein ABIG63_21965, partial [Chloroflexota bacterium]